ncbi:MAG: hypothetical protein PHP87_06080 [Syntrophomonas sp.]|uniref:hypothetical protein n=1 Tax=Syntrophomonas sp. TaxID=2053627 RepID=UPI0026162709|nr:hypothetical protein [Syntrophomonas sp.]MDD4626636.1 hypothetical protein [Syntrophomonas sp.]
MELKDQYFTGTWYDEKHHQRGSVSLFPDKISSSSDAEKDNKSATENTATESDNEKFKHEYGRSGNDRPLNVYKISNLATDEKKNKILCVFAIHGFEDAFYRDGQVLVDIAEDIIAYFINNREE